MATQNIKYKVSQEGAERVASKFHKLAIGIGAAIGVRGILNFAKQSIEAFKIQEIAINKLTSAYGKSTLSLQRYAAELQRVTTFGDEEIMSAMSLIATFVKQEETLKRLTVATLNFAVDKQMSLASSADLITKTFVSTTNALTRYGLTVEGAAGSTERLNSLLNALSVMQGRAEDQAKTTTGQLIQMHNELGDMSEEIGARLIPGLNALTKSFLWFLRSTQEGFTTAFNGAEKLKKELEAIKGLIISPHQYYASLLISPHKEGGGTTEEVLGTVGKLKKELKELGKELEGYNGSLEGSYAIQKRMTEITDLLTYKVKDAAEGWKRLKEAIEKTTEAAGFYTAKVKGIEPSSGGASRNPDITKTMAEGLDNVDKKGQSIFSGWQGILTNNMNQAWFTIFGEANSLFEQFVESMVNQILNAMSGNLLSSALGFIGSFIPGLGPIASAIGATPSSPNNAGTNRIVIQIGDLETEEIVLRGSQVLRRRGLM